MNARNTDVRNVDIAGAVKIDKAWRLELTNWLHHFPFVWWIVPTVLSSISVFLAIYLVRRAKDGETSGRYYKAQADSFANSRIVGFIVVGAASVSASDSIRVYKFGEGALGSADSVFSAADINKPVYLDQSTAGKFTLTPATTSGSILKPVGYVAETGLMEFQPATAIQA